MAAKYFKVASKNFCLLLIHRGAFARQQPGRLDGISPFIDVNTCVNTTKASTASPLNGILLSRRSADDKRVYDFLAKAFALVAKREHTHTHRKKKKKNTRSNLASFPARHVSFFKRCDVATASRLQGVMLRMIACNQRVSRLTRRHEGTKSRARAFFLLLLNFQFGR